MVHFPFQDNAIGALYECDPVRAAPHKVLLTRGEEAGVPLTSLGVGMGGLDSSHLYEGLGITCTKKHNHCSW